MKLCNLRVLFLLLCTLFFPQFIFAAEKPEDEIEEDFTVKDTLLYGIESEIQGFIKEQNAELSEEHMNILYERYLSSVLLQTKMELVRYFTKCEKLPENIKTYIIEEVTNEDTNKELRLAEFAFIAKHGNQDSINYLIDQLSENDIITQQNAAVALSKAKDEPTAGLVLEYLKSTDSSITDDVTDDSEDFEDEEYSDNEPIELSDDIKTILLRAFGEWKYQPATDYLKQLLESEISGKFVKMYAMSSLAQIGDLSAVELMREKLGDEEVKVREFAAASLATFENTAVLPIYMDMLRHNDAKIRVYACQGIAKNKDTTKIDLLIYKFQKDPEASVKNEALWTLLSMGSDGVTKLKETFGEKKLPPTTLSSIATGTVKTPSTENVALLKELYENTDKAGKKAIERIVLRTDSQLLDPILELLLQSEDAEMRLAAAGTLKKIPNTTLINKLKDMKENDSNAAVKRTAAKTLDIIGIQ